MELDTSSENFELIKQDLDKLKHKSCMVTIDDQCDLCQRKLITRQFHLFPCQHFFHSDCLYTQV